MPEETDATAEAAQEAKEAQARTDYEGYLDDVLALKKMTDTAAWRAFYSVLRRMETQHGRDVLNAEKAREIVRHQEGVKLVREIVKRVQQPVENLSNFCNSAPLFASLFDVRAAWNEAIGIVELSQVPGAGGKKKKKRSGGKKKKGGAKKKKAAKKKAAGGKDAAAGE
jgi:hypothetical protein